MKFTIGEYDYLKDDFGIHQLSPGEFKYDAKYVSTYDTPEYKRNAEILQALRYGFTVAAHGRPINDLLDFGCGNGEFLKMVQRGGTTAWGYDITGVKLNDNMHILREFEQIFDYEFDVITFNDSLEHVHDLTFVKDLKCETVVISLPNCPLYSIEWFKEWRHFKENEHVHYFDFDSLVYFMDSMGYDCVAQGYHEDIIRKGNPQNILTAAFKK